MADASTGKYISLIQFSRIRMRIRDRETFRPRLEVGHVAVADDFAAGDHAAAS